MKYKNVNNAFLNALLVCSLFTPFMAQAHIENTIVADYDLATGKSSHYELFVNGTGKQATLTIVPQGSPHNSPSVFKVSACITRTSGNLKQGEYRFSAADADKNDVRLSNISYFVSEHNLRAWWIHLNSEQTLMFNPDVGSLIVSDPKIFNISTSMCQS
ncbi:hypothetical protein C3432_12270 [Citrobacter amalonaticus]|uniref:Uncharacterized protein n=1 Tax=Citrobacter amalonaticus TaxID=35703 RepID=A0A2S4RRK4_CITAM|nr:hypothetical protein [Citrobacter amalonaticus]POT58648.1 hypothetical protein C3432_12270 [Citrobacter amalonaticus]POT70386.1 hypothetical protein C3436_24970 [Citrobacter amalonaticus]POU61370.1 hypothetical protein C3430_23880 [Citrobacter amalonaticus]POV05062.1 hypothetical protein C3424_06850 [Citrobacter amalonaticus]